MYTYNPSYEAGRSRSMAVQSWSQAKSLRPYLKNKLKQKELGVRLKW
jgi:hypothetical protein